jgi:hypothetical protein
LQRATCSISEAAEILGISAASAYRRIRIDGQLNDRIRVLRFGGRYVVPIIDLERVLGPLPWLR